MGVEISKLHVRRSSLIQATPERVWREFASFDRLAAWFGRGHRLDVYEPELGGRVRLSVEIDGAKRPYGGSILAFEPGRELTFSSNWESAGWPVPTLITLRLTPLYDACLVELFHHGFERLGRDAGAELQGYASDVTRTYPIGGTFSGAGRDVYEVVLAAQLAAIERTRPGATIDEIHDAALRRLTEGMVELGLLAGPVDDAIQSGAYRRYYMHRTSHWLGLDVHDVGAYTQSGKPRPLVPGMVLTVEPGLYIPADDGAAPAALRGIGVRIEDDLAITDEGHEILTAEIPKRPADVEAWVRAGIRH